MEPMRASIITIGTEVSSGQIVNSNAAWIADQLVNHKINPVWHLTVPDEPSEILAALDFAAQRSSLLFVTGGLGPTSDDITRQYICQWWGDRLIFQDGSWQKIFVRFQQLGIEAPESNRQQCFFPSQAKVLDNPAGTADAFFLEKNSLKLWCLPGPPEEIKAIWQSNVLSQLSELARDSDAYRLFRWHLIGKSESALGELVEATIKGSSLVSGYRPHVPYIEIKIWCRESELEANQAWIDKLDAALSPWLIGRDDEDCIDRLLGLFQRFDTVFLSDRASNGAIGDRLGKAWRQKFQDQKSLLVQQYSDGSIAPPVLEHRQPKPGELWLDVAPLSEDGTWQITWQTTDQHRQQTLKLPYRRNARRFDHERRFVSEMSLATWSRNKDGELYA